MYIKPRKITYRCECDPPRVFDVYDELLSVAERRSIRKQARWHANYQKKKRPR